MNMDGSSAVPAPTPASLNTTFNGQNTIYVNNLNERKKRRILN